MMPYLADMALTKRLTASLRHLFRVRHFFRRPGILPLLIFLFLISRVLLILWGYQAINHEEDLEQGYIAIELLSGLRAPLINYQVDAYSGGTLIYGLLGAASIYFFGISVFSLKMVALFSSLATFMFAISFVKRFFGPRAAVYAAMLLIFPPPVLAFNSLLVLGSHEVLFPSIAFLFSFCSYLSEKEYKSRAAWLLATGASAGLMLTFSYISVNALAAFSAVLIYFIHTKKIKFSIRGIFVFFLGFGMGGFQWLAYNIAHQYAGIVYVASTIDLNSHGWAQINSFLERVLIFFMSLPYGLSFHSFFGLPLSVTNYFYFVILAVIILNDIKQRFSLHAQPGRIKAPILFFRIYLILYPLFYNLSSLREIYLVGPYSWSYRYLMHFFFFLILYFSICLTRLPFRKLVLGLLVAMGFFSQVAAVWDKPFGEVFQPLAFKSGLRRYVWRHGAHLEFQKSDFERRIAELEIKPSKAARLELSRIANHPDFWLAGSPEEIVELILKTSNKRFRRYFFRRWGIYLKLDPVDPSSVKKFRRIFQAVPQPYQQDFVFGVGRGFPRGDNLRALPEISRFAEAAVPPQNANMFYMSFGNNFFRSVRNYNALGSPPLKINSIGQLDDSQRTWVFRGLGTAIYRSFRFDEILKVNLSFLSAIVPPDRQGDLYWGVGWYLARRHWRKPERGLMKLNQLDLPKRSWAYEGFQYFHSGSHLK